MSAEKTKCHICKLRNRLPIEDKLYPFCSKQCKLIDLGKWVSEDYKFEPEEQEDV